MRHKKTRIVCKAVDVVMTSARGEYIHSAWQECYSSPYKIDCQNWIKYQREKGNNEVLRIFVTEGE